MEPPIITTLYALVDTNYIPKVLLGISFSGIVVSACCYLFTEFALRPVAAQALEAGPPPHRFAQGIMGRTMLVWALGSGVPVLGILLAAVITLSLRNVTPTQFIIAIMILALFALVFGFLLMLLLSWLTATPVRVVRSALKHVEEGDLDRNVVVFDGTELGELQRGFNAMAHGLVNKFEGDAALAVFGAPVTLEHPEDEALACARSIAERLSNEVPGCQAGIGVAAGQVVAGNVGAKERFEYTVIGGRSTRPPGCASWPSLRPAD